MASGPQIDQKTAMDLVKKGATLLLLDVPQFTLLGIDTQRFFAGPIFKGIKMIPPGPHFIHYRSSNKEGNEFSPVVGFFITTHPSEVVVRKWDQQEERLVKVSEDEEGRYAEAVKRFEFDNQLGPYALDRFGEWKQISSYITKSIIERIEPMGGEITVGYESRVLDDAPKTAMEKRLLEQLTHSKFSKCIAEKTHKQGCFYTTIPHLIKHKGISGEELSVLNLDKTKLLETVLVKDFGGAGDLLLGELQFAFVAFMMGQSLEAFLQWKSLVSLLLSCTEAPFSTRSQLFSKFISVLYFQLKYGFLKDQTKKNSVDEGISLYLDDLWFSKDIFLYRLCKDFFPLVLESQVVDGDLLSWTRRLKSLLETTLGWEFEDTPMDFIDEGDEFSPVIVLPNDLSFDESPSS